MRKLFLFTCLFFLAGAFVFISCKKDHKEVVLKKPPVANPGVNKAIILPVDSVLLDGSNSTDEDGAIVSYAWNKTLGPSSFSIVNANSSATWVKDLVYGKYQFELTVTDNDGLSSKQIVTISVNLDCGNRPEVNVQAILIGNLTRVRSNMAVAATSNKIFYAGGQLNSGISSSRVDIYDIATNTWSISELSQARSNISAASLNGKIYFGGGFKWNENVQYSSRVDVYNSQSNSWSIAELSSARGMIANAAAGNKVLFAGGFGAGYHTTVDIFDESNNSWSVSHLANRPEDASVGIATSVIGNKIYFAGAGEWPLRDFGSFTSAINIYDAVAGTWSVSQLDYPRGFIAGISIDNTNYWAGGEVLPLETLSNTYSGIVEYGDPAVQAKSFGCLFQPNANFSAVRKNNKIIFFTGVGVEANKFDIYDFMTNTWSVGVLPFSIRYASIISVDDTIYVAGGYVNGVLSDQVWKLEF